MTIKEVNVPDARPLIMRLCEYKNTKNVKNAFMPPKTLGMPTEKSANYTKCMAMDRCIRNVLSGFKNDIAFTAAPMFVGYAMLSNVSQEALIRAGVETVADEATRKLVQWTYDEDDGSKDTNKEKVLADLETQAAKYKLKERFREAACKDGYFGGCLVYIDVGDLDDVEAEEPLVLDKKTFKKGSLRGFKVIEPINVYPGEYNTDDPTNEHYFNPEFWYVLGKKYHASRFLYIAGNDTPVLLKPAYNFFGIPQAQLALDYVAHFVANRESAQELLNKFSLTCWKTDMTQALQGGSCNDLVSRVRLFNKLKTNNGTMVLNKDTEDMMQINTPLSGVRDIVEMSLNLLTAVWRIPKIKYLGEGEGGLNASSKEQMRSYYDYIMSYKEKVFTQPMETVLKIFQLNLGWDINEAIGFKFPVLWDMDDSERAQLNKQQADRDVLYLSNGVLSQEEVRRRLSLDKNSDYTMIDVDDVPEPQEQPLPEVDKEEQNEVDKKAMDSKITMDEKKCWHSRFKSCLAMDYDSNQKRDKFGKWSKEGSEAFEKAIDSIFSGNYNGEKDVLVLTRPTKVWIDVGLPKKKITFNKNKIEKIIEKHSLKREEFRNLPNLLANPEMIFESATDNDAFVAILKRTTSPMVAALLPVGKEGKAKNVIKSMYKKGENFISENVDAGRLLYDKEKPSQIKRHNNIVSDSGAKSEDKDALIAAEVYSPDNDIITQDVKSVNSENEGYCIELFFLDDLDGDGDKLTQDDKWITIGHRDAEGDDEGRKGRHILLKEGEDPKEALERTIKKDLDKDGKVGKKEEKTKSKTEPKKEEPKKEAKEEKKEPVSEKTPALEYADLLDKENSEGLSDAEKAHKKELEDKEGFGMSEEEKVLEELSNLKKRTHEIDTKLRNEKEEYIKNDPEYKKLGEQAEKARIKAFDDGDEGDFSPVWKLKQQQRDREDFLSKEFDKKANPLKDEKEKIKEKIESMRGEIVAARGKKIEKEAKELTQKYENFTDAKTMSEAKEYAKSVIGAGNFTDADNLHTVNIMNKTLTGLMGKYGSVDKLMTYGSGRMSSAIMHANNDIIEINTSWAKMTDEALKKHFDSRITRETAKKELSELEAKREEAKARGEVTWMLDARIANTRAKTRYRCWIVQSSAENFIRDTVMHEFGHTIMFRKMVEEITKGEYTGGNIPISLIGKKSLTATNVGKTIRSAYAKARKSGDIYEISEYADTNYHEFFAETFAMRESGQKVPDYIEKMLKEVCGK